MNQCVPSWDLDDNPSPYAPKLVPRALHSSSNSLAPDVPTFDYEVAELTWENGQLAMHGLGPPRLPYNKTTPLISSSDNKYSWNKPPTGGTLESIVDQATTTTVPSKSAIDSGGNVGDELMAWLEGNRPTTIPAATNSNTLAMDALVPSSNPISNQERLTQVLESTMPAINGASTHVGSCSGAANLKKGSEAKLARVPHDWSSRPDQSVTGSATCGLESRPMTLDTCERELGTAGFTSPSLGSPGNTSSAKDCTKTADDHDSVCHSRNQREVGDEEGKKKGSRNSSVSTKRSRAAAIHNQSERKRRDKINQRMKTLQKLVPNSSKTDKASMLDEVIEYLKQLQAQVHMMSRMNMSSMMIPLAMQRQLQMSLMAPMGLGVNMGMGLGHVMDMNTIAAARPNIAGMPHVLPPTAFVPAPVTWDGAPGDRLAQCTSAMPDPLSAFLACQSQPMTMDAYSRMAALYQQFQQTQCPAAASKNQML